VANHESALKAHKQSEERRERNRQYRTRLRHALKAMRTAIAKGDKETALAKLSDTVSLIDKLVGKGVIHDNAAGRYKSRLMKRINRTGAPAAATR
jgi:small subunit ribosomal protein S20